MKKNIAFISYSNDDCELAKDIRLLLTSAKNKLKLKGDIFMDNNIHTDEWRKEILQSIPNSCWFIPIFTKNSIVSPWVNFEVGVAKAKNVKIAPIITNTIKAEQITCCDSQAQCLDSEDVIASFLVKVCCINGDSDKQKLEDFIVGDPHVQRIKRRFLERRVYIIGSMPNIAIESQKKWGDITKSFLSNLTKKLLSQGYYITSFPTVEHVGQIVANTVICNHKIDYYSIAGLYEMDNELKEFSKNIPKSQQEEWSVIMSKYRKTYLKNQDFIIVIGGKENTREEIYAAITENVEFIPIPCLFGTAEDFWIESKNSKKQQCLNHSLCKEYKKCVGGDCKKIDKIINLMNAIK